jgi:hypothetical protein
MTQNEPGSETTHRHLALLGGFRTSGAWQVPDRLLVVAAVGGADVDVSGSPLPPVFTMTKFSLVGGTKVTVPADAVVEVEGFSLIGKVRPVPAATPSDRAARVVRVRAYGVVGGVEIARA